MTNRVVPQQPIRIMNIIARLNIGGPAVAVTLLSERLGPPQYLSTLVTGSIDPGEGDMTYYAREHGVEPIVLPELGRALNPLRDLHTLITLTRLIRQEKPDVVHTHTAKAGFIGRWAARWAGVPVIVHTFHGHIFRGYFSAPKTRLFIWLERLTARISDTLITLSDGLRRELAEDYRIARKSQITVLPLGLDLEAFARLPRKQGLFRAAWGIPADAPLIGIVGRITPIKNHGLFVQMAACLREQLPTARFVIVGDGETRAEIEAQVKQAGLGDCVTFTGWQREMPSVYNDLDVTLISSINEGTPVTVIEALAAGCPVVATAVGGLPDLLDQGRLGRLVRDATPEAMAAAVQEVMTHPPDVEVAKAIMLDRYSIDRLVQDLGSLYRGLLAKKQRMGRA